MAKTPNYTPEQTAEMVQAYVAVADKSEAERDAVVDFYAAKFGKDKRSIRAKLSTEKVYVRKTPVAKDGEPAVSKDKLAEEIREITGDALIGIEKANKETIKALIRVIREQRDEIKSLEIDAAGEDA